MFWIVMFIIVGLVGFAYGWITFEKTREQMTIRIETAKIGAGFEKMRQGAARLSSRGRHFFEHSRRS